MPLELYGWTNRFDDSRHRYRTIYLADDRLTCLRELMQDLRPDPKAVAEYRALFPEGEAPPTAIPRGWVDRHAFVQASATVDGPESDLASLGERDRIERQYPELLARHGIGHLNLSELTSRQRDFTQELSTALYDEGKCGILFPSNVGDGRCFCLFEGRGLLEQIGPSEPLTASTSG
jgi:hypothetical protein